MKLCKDPFFYSTFPYKPVKVCSSIYFKFIATFVARVYKFRQLRKKILFLFLANDALSASLRLLSYLFIRRPDKPAVV